MKNNFGGVCYRCGLFCKQGEGHFERRSGRWVVQHERCRLAAYSVREAIWHSEGFAMAMSQHPELTQEQAEKSARKYVETKQKERRQRLEATSPTPTRDDP
jgi:hypothetical protein